MSSRTFSRNSGGCPAGLRLGQGRMRLCIPRAVTAFKSEGASMTLPETDEQRSVRVRISTHFQAAFGEGLKVVGSHPVLGSWDLGEAPDMTWTDGHVWVSDLGVPEGADFEFKIVHLTYGGASWEPSSNRPLKAAGVPEDAALDVACSFGYPELTAVQLTSARPLDDVTTDVWNPTYGGLPADLTADLSQQAAKAISKATNRGDSLPSVMQSGGSATWSEVREAAPEFKAGSNAAPDRATLTSAATATSATVATSAADLTPDAAVTDVPDESLPAVDSTAAKPSEQESAAAKAQKDRNIKAAGTLAMGLAAGVVMSALAMDLTDAAVAGALLAAGATFMPAKDAKVARKISSNVLSSGLSATEAIARGFGLKSHAERRAEASGEAAAQLPAEEAAAEAERRLAASIAEAEALLSEGADVEYVNNVVPKEAGNSPSAGMILAAAAIAVGNAEKAVQESMDEQSD
ncbi:hypothetical protein WJX75_002219 [Coccomyxa subellipsoidea]|uniref:CBM20 domain-containing protein n=1 Tax=Coccomyxa subellipsoidea TaxID=248742 RepID=A0ABR2YYF7_9CHLO